jgi:hypothetical protein
MSGRSPYASVSRLVVFATLAPYFAATSLAIHSTPPLLVLDDGDALPAQHEEALLRVLRVVEAVGLARMEHVNVRSREEVEPGAEARDGLPRHLAEVADEPAGAGRHLPFRGLFDLSFLHEGR